jgi:diguanylate cyclase (GGDEF)-like protein
MSMLVIDIDFFKEFNDAYGHAEGDNCLIAIARLLEDTVGRPTDLFARIGGEEFVLLLPDCNAVGAVQKAEKILNLVNQAKIPHERSSIASHLTVSLGIATMYPSDGNSALSLFQAADDWIGLLRMLRQSD